MILDLTPYQAEADYPEVRTVRRDPALAQTLMEGYSGAVSEMTTVLQYAYHSLRCRESHRELYQMMRGIFHVETIHMELLGNCVQKLGVDPLYSVQIQEKVVCWQSLLVTYEQSPAKMLQADIQGEQQAVAYYLDTAAGLDRQPDIQRLLLRLAEDEKLHVRMLTDLYRRTFRK